MPLIEGRLIGRCHGRALNGLNVLTYAFKVTEPSVLRVEH